MFTTKRKAEADMKAAKSDLIQRVLDWHESHEEKQKVLECGFDINKLTSISVNLWDDYDEVEGTYLYVEDSKIPEAEQFKILNQIYNALIDSESILRTGVKVGMRYYDSSTRFLALFDEDTYPLARHASFRRWEVTFANINSSIEELIVNELKKISTYQGIRLKILNES